jgi:hypothetical protein
MYVLVAMMAIFEDQLLSELFARVSTNHRERWNAAYNTMRTDILTDEVLERTTAFVRAPHRGMDETTQGGLQTLHEKDAEFWGINLLTALADLEHLDQLTAQRRLEMWLRIHLYGCVDRALADIPRTMCVRDESIGATSCETPDLDLQQESLELAPPKFLIGEEKRCGASLTNVATRGVTLGTHLCFVEYVDNSYVIIEAYQSSDADRVKLGLMLRTALGDRAPADSEPVIYGVQWFGLQLSIFSMSWVMEERRAESDIMDDYYACTQVFHTDMQRTGEQAKHAILRAILALRFLIAAEVKADPKRVKVARRPVSWATPDSKVPFRPPPGVLCQGVGGKN